MKVLIRKDNVASITKAKSKGYVFVKSVGDLDLYEKVDYVKKIKTAAQTLLGYVQIRKESSWLK